MKRYPRHLNNQAGAISLEMVVTIPIVIYCLIVIVGFFQVVNNYSVLSFNIANARNKFNYSYIVETGSYSDSLKEFYETIVDNVNTSVIDVNYNDLTLSCFTSLDDLKNNKPLSSCGAKKLEDIKLFTIDITYSYSAFSSLFATYYEKYFTDMNHRVVIVNEYD